MMDLRHTLPNLKNLLLTVSTRAYDRTAVQANGKANGDLSSDIEEAIQSPARSIHSGRSESPAPTIKATRRNSMQSEKQVVAVSKKVPSLVLKSRKEANGSPQDSPPPIVLSS
jgi:hypothetical protein